MRRRSSMLGISLALVLVATPLFATAQAGEPDVGRAAALASAFWPGVPHSDGTELAALDFESAPAELEGAVVVASLWPALETRAAMWPGDTFHLTPIDRATLVHGKANVHVADAAVLRSHKSLAGAVILHLDVFTADGMTVFVSERAIGKSGKWVESAYPDAESRLALTFDSKRVEKLDLPAETNAVSPLVQRHHEGVLQCSGMTYDSNTTATETVQVAGVYKGIQAAFTYTNSASTSSGMGVQIGTNATWSQNSLATRTSTLTAPYNVETGPNAAWAYREWRANWSHYRYWRHCPNTPDTGYHTQRFTEPYKVNGFPATVTSRYPNVPCVARNILTGVSSVETETANGIQFDQGFSITYGGATFKGSDKSNYSSAVKMKFIRPAAITGYWFWCGDAAVAQDSHWVKAGR